MLGEPGWGTYVAYGAIILFLVVVVALFLRLASMLSLLFPAPLATVARRIRGSRKGVGAPDQP